ncbi:MAG: hypothetical protein US67_C0078G0007 [Candidatus Woesebacteria bacterium GW2011_GWD1_38_10]|uniref:Uncharacterized protein n=1 Tax=Candidatus Woesebacteria bacterium GW2011_GWD1_38_10 TaxID=1618592 RepID=A0A0G0I6B2_9BACT|nr:MAG: hypothetical protein US67_C0078G0007 [Candidatus Woesebacteria bacterium GW2011_GWD1_38_10]
MAPKAETLFGKIERYLGQQANNKAQQIQQEGVNAYARGDTKAVRESTHQYDAVKGFPFELAERIRDVNDLIRKYGLDEIDIPIDEIKVSKDASRTEIAEAITTPTLKSKDRVQRSSNYKTGYGGIVGLDLIEKADRGGVGAFHPSNRGPARHWPVHLHPGRVPARPGASGPRSVPGPQGQRGRHLGRDPRPGLGVPLHHPAASLGRGAGAGTPTPPGGGTGPASRRGPAS